MVTEATRRMIAERAAREAKPPPVKDLGAEVFALIDKAAPFIDEGCPADKWPPSAKLKVCYCAGATGESGHKKSALFVLAMINRARRLWLAGKHPDPWAASPSDRL